MRYAAALIFFLATTCAAEEPAEIEYANCSWYRSKKDGVVVYAEAKADAQVIDKLAQGERVCGIGEQSGFVVLQWEKQALLRGGKKGPELRAFARTVDLWEPRDRAQKPGQETKELMEYHKTGTAPDDPLWFLRPVLDLFFTRDPCADKSRVGCN